MWMDGWVDDSTFECKLMDTGFSFSSHKQKQQKEEYYICFPKEWSELLCKPTAFQISSRFLESPPHVLPPHTPHRLNIITVVISRQTCASFTVCH